jgi:hypothetical protein
MKFTIENEKQTKIPFLDTKVTRKETNFTTSIYHKPTFTGVYLNWTSLTSREYKISLIYCLCDRMWKICQDTERDLEFKKLKLTLPKNEYPDRIINKEMDKFVKNRTIREQQIKASGQPIEQQQNSRKTKKIYSSAKKDSAIQTHLQENPTHLFDPEHIENWIKPPAILKSDLKKNFTSSHTSLNSIANMQLHTKENTIKICSSPT